MEPQDSMLQNSFGSSLKPGPFNEPSIDPAFQSPRREAQMQAAATTLNEQGDGAVNGNDTIIPSKCFHFDGMIVSFPLTAPSPCSFNVVAAACICASRLGDWKAGSIEGSLKGPGFRELPNEFCSMESCGSIPVAALC